MSLYPPSHQPFIYRGLMHDQSTAEAVHRIAQQTALEHCLDGAHLKVGMSRVELETLRAALFRAEQLIVTQPLPDKPSIFVLLPHEVPALLESLKACLKCLEAWMESEVWQAILTACQTSELYQFSLRRFLNKLALTSQAKRSHA